MDMYVNILNEHNHAWNIHIWAVRMYGLCLEMHVKDN